MPEVIEAADRTTTAAAPLMTAALVPGTGDAPEHAAADVRFPAGQVREVDEPSGSHYDDYTVPWVAMNALAPSP